jgi:type 1 glutamine amidotransferase
MATPIMTAVITGSHAFDVPEFDRMWRSFTGIDPYQQDLDNLLADAGKTLDRYDALAFYNMPRTVPEGKVLEGMERCGESSQGIVIIHHALLGFAGWPRWCEICGVQRGDNFSYHPNESVPVAVADPDHAITRGLAPFTITDETYVMTNAAEGSNVLLTTTHPQSLRTIAWTRQYKKARVFCIALGHDALAYRNPSFRTLIERGVAWAAGRL